MLRCARFSLLLVMGGLCATASAADAPAGDLLQIEQLQNRLADVADRVRPSIVAIRAERRLDEEADKPEAADSPDANKKQPDKLYPSVGSGFIISTDGLVMTNEHVIHGAEPENIECVLYDGQTYTVQGITSDPRSDLAVLRIEAKSLRPVKLGDLATVRQGHFAIVLGNPFGSASENYGRPAMSFGVISALGQDLTQKLDLTQQRYYGNLIQTDARINPGNSGGPLLNIKGEVIGITTAISTRSGSSEGVGYAIAIDERTKGIIARLTRGEEVEYGFIGVRLDRPTEAERRAAGGPLEGGAVVKEVTAGGPAAAAKLEPGDIIVEFAKHQIEDVDQLIRLVGSAPIGQKADVVFYRNSERKGGAIVPERKQVLRGVNRDAPLAWRGMKLSDPTDEVRSTFKLPDGVAGVIVVEVETGGAAEKAGIHPGMSIRSIEGKTVRSVRRCREVIATATGPVEIETGDSELTLP